MKMGREKTRQAHTSTVPLENQILYLIYSLPSSNRYQNVQMFNAASDEADATLRSRDRRSENDSLSLAARPRIVKG